MFLSRHSSSVACFLTFPVRYTVLLTIMQLIDYDALDTNKLLIEKAKKLEKRVFSRALKPSKGGMGSGYIAKLVLEDRISKVYVSEN